MTNHLDRILAAGNVDEVCAELQSLLDSCRDAGHLDQLPEEYQDIAARSPHEVQDWCELMKGDERAREQADLLEIRDFFLVALRSLRGLGFHHAD